MYGSLCAVKLLLVPAVQFDCASSANRPGFDQMFSDPQVEHLGIAQSVTRKDKSKMRLIGQPVTLSRTPSRLAARPPELGEHTDSILKEFGFSKRDIAALHKANAV